MTYETFLAKPIGEQKDIMQSLHWEQLKSVKEIADMFGTYNNKLRRWAKKNGFNVRDKGAAQSVCIQTGRSVHPTKGRERTETEKLKIGKTVSEQWESLSDEEKERRAEIAKENWDSRSQLALDDMARKATKSRLKAAKEGSKLEKLILQALIDKGLKTEFHKEHLLLNERVHVDIWLPELKVALEIDGPTHFLPIWGEEHLKKTQKTDNLKDGLILNSGFCIIRLRQKKGLSKTYVSNLVSDLIQLLNKIEKNFPELGKRKIILGDNYA